jgi:hypothetical protein
MLCHVSGTILGTDGKLNHEFPQRQQGGASLPLVAPLAEKIS